MKGRKKKEFYWTTYIYLLKFESAIELETLVSDYALRAFMSRMETLTIKRPQILSYACPSGENCSYELE